MNSDHALVEKKREGKERKRKVRKSYVTGL